MNHARCPLCRETQLTDFHRDKRRSYQRCGVCQLISVPPEFHLSAEEEKRVYENHQNSPDDLRYRGFLDRLFQPVAARVPAESRGLDFGAGPGPTLSVMFAEAGHTVKIYDPYYSPDESPLSQQYDFVTASEVVEHFCDPSTDLNRMWDCVSPGGVLGIMTKRARDKDAFADWHYKNDPTHVSFFCLHTFSWLAEQWQADVTFPKDDVVLIERSRA